MDALDSDHYLYAYVGHIDKLDQMDVHTWMDVEIAVDDDEVVALDMVMNVIVLPSFVVDQDDILPLDRWMILWTSYVGVVAVVVVVVEFVPFDQVYKTYLYYWEYKHPKI